MALITESYRDLNTKLHRDAPSYGTSAIKNLGNALALIEHVCALDLLDYGCGKQALKPHLKRLVAYRGYDPCIPELSEKPASFYDVVLCTDVMEHVEPECVDEVLEDVIGYARRAVYFTISTVMGSRFLADGKPAHRSVHNREWWLSKLSAFGSIELYPQISKSDELVCVVYV